MAHSARVRATIHSPWDLPEPWTGAEFPLIPTTIVICVCICFEGSKIDVRRANHCSWLRAGAATVFIASGCKIVSSVRRAPVPFSLARQSMHDVRPRFSRHQKDCPDALQIALACGGQAAVSFRRRKGRLRPLQMHMRRTRVFTLCAGQRLRRRVQSTAGMA
jgi:hypothetical protein